VNINVWLEELGVPREAYRVVSLLPLVYVAWADGRVQTTERNLITRIAREKGLLEHGGAEALDRWLTEPPTKDQLRKDILALNELARSDRRWAAEVDVDDEQLLLAWCQDVADAAGGRLGLRSARSEAELDALKTIVATLDIGGAKQWRAALTRASVPAPD
jgi:hypothetical protein